MLNKNGISPQSISGLFTGINNTNRYIIPVYQREYTWNKDNYEELYTDLMEGDNGHFLGTVIFKNLNNDSGLNSYRDYEVIDGQQRLITVSLLYACIYNKLNGFDANDMLIAKKFNIKNNLVQETSNDKTLKLELSTQNNNKADYEYLMQYVNICKNETIQMPKRFYLRRIYKAYSYFEGIVNELDYDNLITLLSKLDSAMLVSITTESSSDAFTIFECINDRGTPLSAIDLIKNNILCEYSKVNGDDALDKGFTIWKSIVENLTDDSTIQTRFLRQYYNAFKYKNNINIEGIARATKSNVVSIYEKLIDKDVNFLLQDFIEKSKIYASLVNSDDLYVFCNKELINLINVKAAPAYTFLMYLFSKYSEDEVLLKRVVEFLVKYFVRRNVTDYPNTRNLDTIFINLINKCEEPDIKVSFDLILDFLTKKEHFSSAEDFVRALDSDLYEINADVTRFLLCSLQTSAETNERAFTDLWKIVNNKYFWTIEHILPQSSNLSQEWLDMIANGDKDIANEIQSSYVHKVGNLTLSGYNQNLGKMPFKEKRDRIDKSGHYIGYKNKMELNDDLKDKEEWTKEDIITRSKKLISNLFDLFKLENEMLPENYVPSIVRK